MSIEFPPQIDEIVQKLDARRPLPPLAPEKEWDTDLTKRIQEAKTTDLFDGQDTQRFIPGKCREIRTAALE